MSRGVSACRVRVGADDALEQLLPVQHQQADGRRELELQRLLGQRRARG